MNRIVLTIVALILLAPSTFAQSDADKSNANLQETLEWINGKVSYEYRFHVYLDNGYTLTGFEPISFNGCEINWKVTSEERKKGDAKEVNIREYKVDLSKLEPTKIEVTKLKRDFGEAVWYVTIPTFNNKRVVSVTSLTGENKGKTFEHESFSFLFKEGDEEVARRVAKAFTHVITLCGGKKEPF